MPLSPCCRTRISRLPRPCSLASLSHPSGGRLHWPAASCSAVASKEVAAAAPAHGSHACAARASSKATGAGGNNHGHGRETVTAMELRHRPNSVRLGPDPSVPNCPRPDPVLPSPTPPSSAVFSPWTPGLLFPRCEKPLVMKLSSLV